MCYITDVSARIVTECLENFSAASSVTFLFSAIQHRFHVQYQTNVPSNSTKLIFYSSGLRSRPVWWIGPKVSEEIIYSIFKVLFQHVTLTRSFKTFCVVLCIDYFVSFFLLFVCKCVLYYCHRVATQLQFNKYVIYHTYPPNYRASHANTS